MQPLTAAEVGRRLEAEGIAVAIGEAESLARYVELLLKWNRVHNLTGARDPALLVDRHLTESLALKDLLRGPEIADIGSGGGLPGIPLAICLPEFRFTLIESRRKRVSFLRHVAVALGLGNVTVAHGRAEELDLPAFSTVLARAVAPPAELLAIAGPLVGPGGRLVLLTGEEKGREVVALARGFRRIETGAKAAGLRSVIVALERELP